MIYLIIVLIISAVALVGLGWAIGKAAKMGDEKRDNATWNKDGSDQEEERNDNGYYGA